MGGALEGMLELVNGFFLVKKTAHGGQHVAQLGGIASPWAGGHRHASRAHTGPTSGER